MFYSIWVLISWDILFVSAQTTLVRDTHFTHYFIQNVKIFVFYLLTFRMPEHVLLPIQKFKELVDYTKRVNDIITGFIRKKPKNENPEEQQKQEVKSRKRKIEPATKSEPAKKKSRPTQTEYESKPKATIPDQTPITPPPSDASSDESESEPEEVFWSWRILH